MSGYSPKERLRRVLDKQGVDRPPVLCTGGMMNAAIVDVMQSSQQTLPAGHTDADLMARLATAVHQATGFENIGVPFCMTVEAEALGSAVDLGTFACEPKVAKEKFASSRETQLPPWDQVKDKGRLQVVAQATQSLARQHADVPVIGSLTGPISTAASMVDPMTFLRDLRRDPENAHRVMEHVADFLIEYARLLVASGASAICIGDPTATGEILGPKAFQEYAVRYLNRVIAGIHAAGVPVIVHICGDMKRVLPLVPEIQCDALSTDAMVNLRALKEQYPQVTTMGNLSTFLLQWGPTEKISHRAEQLLTDKIDIISPACGLSTSTSLEHIRAMTRTVRKEAVDHG